MIDQLFDPDDPVIVPYAILASPSGPTPGFAHAEAGDTENGAARLVAPRTGTQRSKVLWAIARAYDGLTDHEIASTTGLYLYSAAPRRVELVNFGWVVDSGKRRMTPNGAKAIVWKLVDAARFQLGEAP